MSSLPTDCFRFPSVFHGSDRVTSSPDVSDGARAWEPFVVTYIPSREMGSVLSRAVGFEPTVGNLDDFLGVHGVHGVLGRRNDLHRLRHEATRISLRRVEWRLPQTISLFGNSHGYLFSLFHGFTTVPLNLHYYSVEVNSEFAI